MVTASNTHPLTVGDFGRGLFSMDLFGLLKEFEDVRLVQRRTFSLIDSILRLDSWRWLQ